MTVRPRPVMSLAALAALALLVTLGVWQLERRAWKQDLIAEYEASAAAEPVTLAEAICVGDLRQRPIAPPEARESPSLRMYGFNAAGEPGWRILRLADAPGCLAGARGVLVQTGFERLADGVAEPVSRLRLAVMPEAGPLAPENAPARNEWHQFDRGAMAAAFGLEPGALAQLWARDDAPPASLTSTPPARHLGYALTWFGLALTLIGVYFAYHVREGRFRLK